MTFWDWLARPRGSAQTIEVLRGELRKAHLFILRQQKTIEGLNDRLLLREGIEPVHHAMKADVSDDEAQELDPQVVWRQGEARRVMAEWRAEIADLRRLSDSGDEDAEVKYEQELVRFEQARLEYKAELGISL